jgi:hypothetical protein
MSIPVLDLSQSPLVLRGLLARLTAVQVAMVATPHSILLLS